MAQCLIAILETNASVLANNLASITFFDTPHAGSTLASGIVSTASLLGLREYVSRQMAGLEKDAAPLKTINQTFLKIAFNREIQILNLISTARILGARVAEADLPEHPLIKTVRVSKDHSAISKPSHNHDEVCHILENFLSISNNRYTNRTIDNRTCIIHFLDHHFLMMKNIPPYVDKIHSDDRTSLIRAFRLSILMFDKVIVPIASLVESEVAAEIFGSHKKYFDSIFSSENHNNIGEYIEDSRRRIGDRYIFIPNNFEKFGFTESIPIHLRGRSATPDILRGISQVDVELFVNNIKNLLRSETEMQMIKRNWSDFAKSDAAQFVIPPIFEKFLLEGGENKALRDRLARITNEYYFDSFVKDFNGWLVNPRGGAYHTFEYISQHRIVDIVELLNRSNWRAFSSKIAQMDLSDFQDFYFSNKREYLRAEIWELYSKSLK